VCKDKTQKSTVKKNCLDPDWKPQEKFEFDLSSGDLADIEIQLKEWNMTSSAKLLGTTVIGVDALKRLMAHLVLKVAVVAVEKTGKPMEDVVIKADTPKMQVKLYSALPQVDGDPRMLDHKEKDVPLPEGRVAVKVSKTNEYVYVYHERKLKVKVHPNFDQRKEKCIEDLACDVSLANL
jgi:hypothetical protein